MPIPKEHGAWAVLYAPIAVTLVAVGGADVRALLFLIAVTALFLAHEPFTRLARLRSARSQDTGKLQYWTRWLVLYLLTAAGAALPLLLHYQLWQLLPLGLAALLLLVARTFMAGRRQEKSFGGEFLGVVGLTLTAPGTYYVMQGHFDALAFVIWVLNVLYFTSGIFYIKMRISRFAHKAGSHSLAWQCGLYHLGLPGLVALTLSQGWLSEFTVLAFVPVILRAFWGMGATDGKPNLRRIGYAEVGLTAVFVIFLAIGLVI